MLQECLFCKIIRGEIPSEKVFENDSVVAFKDIYPSAKMHFLFIHKNHSSNIIEMTDKSPQELIDIFTGISRFSKDKGLVDGGLRIVTNQGPDAGQTVFHTHFHLLGGEKLKGFGA